jgi:hypothetical protein
MLRTIFLVGVEAKPLKKVNKPHKIRREGSFVMSYFSPFKLSSVFIKVSSNVNWVDTLASTSLAYSHKLA